jgi:hypothetical protein
LKISERSIRRRFGGNGVKGFFDLDPPIYSKEKSELINGMFRHELHNGESFDSLVDDKVLTEKCRKVYNTVRLHSA